MRLTHAATALLLSTGAVAAKKPNIVFFLTDDQDQMLGGSFPAHNGATPMSFTQRELSDKGATALNWVIHTPICCPSRSETVTGRYFHNLKTKGMCPRGYGAGDCCMHVNENLVNNATFAKRLKDNGYTVGIFGKYLNNCPPKAPPGFDAYFANGGGTYYSPAFAVQNIDGFPDGPWKGGPDNYSTSVIGNVSLAWIRKQTAEKPFFAYIAPKAAHEPFLPAPWYNTTWDPSWPEHEPRPESWNCSAESRKDHHYTIATEPMIGEEDAASITAVFKDRWRTLMSVDDLIRDTMQTIENMGMMDNTYFFYSSDHGFQLGEFNLPFDKRHVYDFDIRIHLLIRGPGIKPGSTFDYLGSNVDFAATWLGLAGIERGSGIDGKSIVPLIVDGSDANVPESTAQHLARHDERYVSDWRQSILIEYYFVDNNTKCIPDCYNIEDASNNYIGLRKTNPKGPDGNMLYAEFQTSNNSEVYFDQPDFYEVYDVEKDPWEMNNLYGTTPSPTLERYRQELHAWFTCAEDTCP